MHPNETRIREFYAAFARRDAEGMARCYHADIFFSDAVFPRLRGPAAADRWRMLLSRAFGRTGRRVVNHVEAMFAFRDGLIVRHYDRFPFWAWAAQALGPTGKLLGWFALLKWKVRRQAAESLERFRDPEG